MSSVSGNVIYRDSGTDSGFGAEMTFRAEVKESEIDFTVRTEGAIGVGFADLRGDSWN